MASPGCSRITFERIQEKNGAESVDYLEGKNAFYEKRKPVFKGE